MPDTNDDRLRQEEVRARVHDPLRRWRELLARIAWVEANTVHRATPAACVREQRRLWASMEQPAQRSHER